jgi:hypothetical protein
MALAVVAVYLIVTGKDYKRVQIGVILGVWSAFIGTFVFVRLPRDPAAAPNSLPVAAPSAGQELDLRKFGEIERMAIANAVDAARREFRVELEDMLRREVQAGLAQEVAGLRAEVMALRNELVEKVGGQLRLERIETTRLIGSDLEALQHELRQLREVGAREPEPVPEVHEAEIVVERLTPPLERQPEPEPVRPAAPEPEPAMQATADLRKVVPHVAPEVVREPEPQPEPEPEPVAQAAPESERQPEPEPVPEPVREPVSVASSGSAAADPFASMPRITPFTDFELDPIPAAGIGDEVAARAGRHASASDDGPARGHRHRADDGGEDVLARILAREGRD